MIYIFMNVQRGKNHIFMNVQSGENYIFMNVQLGENHIFMNESGAQDALHGLSVAEAAFTPLRVLSCLLPPCAS